jgi:hypothetical protein
MSLQEVIVPHTLRTLPSEWTCAWSMKTSAACCAFQMPRLTAGLRSKHQVEVTISILMFHTSPWLSQ